MPDNNWCHVVIKPVQVHDKNTASCIKNKKFFNVSTMNEALTRTGM